MASSLTKVVVVVVTTALAASQNDTVPALLNGVEGGSASSIPFGLNQPVRVQYVIDAEELPWSGPRMIQRVSLRADNTDPGTTAFAAKGFVFVSLSMSTSSVTAEAASAVFADNHGTDRMLVVDNVALMLPAQPATTSVRAASIDLVLPTPWFYGLTPARPNRPAPANLVLELVVHSQPTGTYRIDNYGSCLSPTAQFGNRGPACQPAGGAELLLQPGSSLIAGGSFSWTIDQAPPSAPMLLMIGVQSGGLLFGHPGLPLPLPLFDPADPMQPHPVLAQVAPTIRYGAADCWLNLQPFESLFTVADPAGHGVVTISLAADRALIGATLYAQAAAYSQTANPLQLVTSFGHQSTVCGPFGVARIYSLNDLAATSGQKSLGQGPVLELH